jgi:uracil-DNA glycosylase
MQMSLRDALEQLLQGWRDDLSKPWSKALAGAEPDFAAVDPALVPADDEVIYPGRKGAPPPGARADSHMFRALDGITPGDVRVVVMGQDPYTHVQQATGRSFEQGDLHDWKGKPRVSPSLRRLVQAVALRRTGDRRYAEGDAGWKALVHDVGAGTLAIEPPQPLWDKWQAQGVLFVNAILTFNRFDPAFQFGGHQPLWRPVIRRLLGHLVERPDRALVCVAWGGKALAALQDARVEETARAAGAWETRVRIVRAPHPNAPPPEAPPFLAQGDRLQEVNDALAAMGAASVDW